VEHDVTIWSRCGFGTLSKHDMLCNNSSEIKEENNLMEDPSHCHLHFIQGQGDQRKQGRKQLMNTQM